MAAQMWALVAEMNAISANVEGMKAENNTRRSNDYSDAYGPECFFAAQEDLEKLALRLTEI